MSMFAELQRRNMFKVSASYAVGAWILAQIAVVLETSLHLPDWVDGLSVTLLLLGLPVAIVLAWAFEWTADGIRPTQGDGSGRVPRGRVMAVAAIGTAALAIAIFSGRAMIAADASSSPVQRGATVPADFTPSIAVLPFRDFSPDGDQTYFAEGIAEELLNVLARTNGLRVASRTSAFSYSGDETPIPDIAKALGVRHVLEGSVRKAGDTLRITAQLIDTHSDTHLWSNTYDRELSPDAIFAIQDDISREIVRELMGRLDLLTSDASAPTLNQGALELYLRGKAAYEPRTVEAIDEAVALLSEAVRLDPDFARAYAQLARAYHLQAVYTDVPADRAYALADINLDKAVALDPDDPDVLLAKAWVETGRLPASELLRLFDDALVANPGSAEALRGRASALTVLARFDESRASLERAVAIDPRSTQTWNNLAAGYHRAGRHEERDAALANVLELDPTNQFSLQILSGEAFGRGDVALAHRLAKQGGDAPVFRSMLNAIYFGIGLPDLIDRPGLALQMDMAFAAGDTTKALGLAYGPGSDTSLQIRAIYFADDLSAVTGAWEASPFTERYLTITSDRNALLEGLQSDSAFSAIVMGYRDLDEAGAEAFIAPIVEVLLSETSDAPTWHYNRAIVLGHEGHIDEAFESARIQLAPGNKPMLLTVDPGFDPLRDDPRWDELVQLFHAKQAEHRAAVTAQLDDPPEPWWSPAELSLTQ